MSRADSPTRYRDVLRACQGGGDGRAGAASVGPASVGAAERAHRVGRPAAAVATALLGLFAATAASAQTSRTDDVLIRGARVHTVTEKGTLDNADVLVRGGKISDIGPNITAPSGVPVVDAKGKALTPGLFGGLTSLGLQEVQMESATNNGGLTDKMPLHELQLRPEFDPTPMFNPRSVAVPVARIAGVTWTVLDPGDPSNGGGMFITGQGSAVTLDGRFDATLPGSRSLFVSLDSDAVSASGGSRAGQFMLLDQAIRETRTPAAETPQALLHPAGRDALKRYLAGGRVLFEADRAVDIRQAIAFAQANGMKPVIVGGAEAWVVASDLAKAKVSVILDPLVNLPGSFDRLGARLDNAARLNRAGVKVAFTLFEDPTQRARRIRQLAGNAAAHGLPRDVALAAITATPADIFGLTTRGRIAPGQAADLVLWSGDPLEVTTVAEQVWIAGAAVEMKSRQTELRDRYVQKLRAGQAR